MKKTLSTLGLMLIVLVTTSQQVQASDPAITGEVNGIELCPQFICGSALFAGYYVGEVDGKLAIGTWSAAVNHEPLPDLGDDPVAVTGGTWKLNTWVLQRFFFSRKTFSGVFETGTLQAIEGNFFQVEVPMTITRGGSGSLQLNLLLDENSIPQPVTGTLQQ